VKDWATLNEPYCSSITGYAQGTHAPGLTDPAKALRAAHHLLLAHGRAVPVLRSESRDAKVGIVLNLGPFYPASDSEADRDTARFADGQLNRWFLDPLYNRGYPADTLADYARPGAVPVIEPDFIDQGDFAEIGAPTDFLGINYYTRGVVRALPGKGNHMRHIHGVPAPADNQTAMGWEIYPEGLTEILERVHREYKPASIVVAENGASYPDGPGTDGKVHDEKRIAYLRSHFQAMARAIQAGVPLDGYYVWSFMDNFEWRFGFSQRFGLVHVNFETQERTPKDSAFWYGQISRRNAIELE
jgi:beta-glucosidase